MANYITWDTAEFKWGSNPHLWSLVLKAAAISLGGAAKLKTLSADEKTKVIRLVMQFKGIEVYNERQEVKNIKAYASDIRLIAEEIKRNVQIIY